MKKKFLILFLLLFCITGCFNKGSKDVVSSLKKKIDNTNSYHIVGQLEIINNEDSYTYDVDVAYQEDENFRVSLKNKTNNHEQIILKNSEGVYVLTPSLNKSFKFQSDWPYNNSQIYLLQTLLKDIEDDTDKIIEEKEGTYIITTKVNYPNNKNLVKQKIYVDKNMNIIKVEITNNEDIIKMKMSFNKIDLNATYKDEYFNIDSNMTINETSKTLNEIDDIIYPMYMPENTYLESQDTVTLDNGERVILTFAGKSPFMIIEETVNVTDDYETTIVYGDPEIMLDTIGSVGENSVSFISGGIEYYAVSEVLDKSELLQVVNSISTIPVGK